MCGLFRHPVGTYYGRRRFLHYLGVSRLHQLVDLVIRGHHGHRIVRRPLRYTRRVNHLTLLVVLAVFGGFHVLEKPQYFRILRRRFPQLVQLPTNNTCRVLDRVFSSTFHLYGNIYNNFDEKLAAYLEYFWKEILKGPKQNVFYKYFHMTLLEDVRIWKNTTTIIKFWIRFKTWPADSMICVMFEDMCSGSTKHDYTVINRENVNTLLVGNLSSLWTKSAHRKSVQSEPNFNLNL